MSNSIAQQSTILASEFTEQNYQTIDLSREEVELSRARKLARIRRKGRYTVDEAIEYIGIGKYHYTWMFLYGLSSMTQAVEVTLSSVILNTLACEWDLTILEMVLIPSLVLIAAIPGDYVGGWMADIHGRKIMMILGQSLIAIFGVISAFMPDYYCFIIVRCVVGFGFGIVTVLVIVQVIELCPTAYRASAVAGTFIMWAVGDCYIVIGAYFLLSAYGWRAVVLWAALPCVILAFIIPFMDESPKFSVITEHPEKARDVLTKIAHCNGLEMVEGELVSAEEKRRGRIEELVNENYLEMTICLCICTFAANFVYIGNVFDTPYLFSEGYCDSSYVDTGVSCYFTLSDLIYTLIVCIGEFVSIPMFAILSELQGRIKGAQILTSIMIAIIFVCLFCFGTVVLLVELFLTRAFSNAILLMFFIFTPESYPTYMRSISFGVVMLFANLGGVCAIFMVYMVGLTISWKYMFYSFLAASIVLALVSCCFQKETVGTRLEDNRCDTTTATYSEGPMSVRDEDVPRAGTSSTHKRLEELDMETIASSPTRLDTY